MAESYYGRAEIRRRDGRVDEALELFRDLLESRPGMPRAVVHYAAFLDQIGRPDEARSLLESGNARPSFHFHQVHVRIALGQGRLEDARRHAVLSIQKDPFHEEGWFHLGLVEERLAKLDDAIAAYGQSVACERSFQPAYEASAALLLRHRRFPEAVAWLRKTSQHTPAWWNLAALCLSGLGAAEEGLDAVREATRIGPENQNYWANRARLALRAGRRAEAETSREEALSRNPLLADALDPELKRLFEETEQSGGE